MKTVNKNIKSNIKKRYCEHCDGINSGGFYDDICMVQELDELDKYFFEVKNEKTGNWESGCQVPAKVWKELEALYCNGIGDCNYSGFAICDALAKQRVGQSQPFEAEISEMGETIQEDDVK